MIKIGTVEKLLEILKETSGDDGVTLQTKFGDIGFDSLDIIEVVMLIEKEFSVEISDGLLTDMEKELGDITTSKMSVSHVVEILYKNHPEFHKMLIKERADKIKKLENGV